MNYQGIMSADGFMAKIIKALNNEVQKGDVYPLMATYSETTCDRKYLEGCDYVCVNIKRDEDIFVVDIYPADPNDDNHRDRVVLSLFRRKDPSYKNKWNKSLYKMTPGTKYKAGEHDSVIDRIIANGLTGFSPKVTWFGRMEKKVSSTDLIDEVRQIIDAVRKTLL